MVQQQLDSKCIQYNDFINSVLLPPASFLTVWALLTVALSSVGVKGQWVQPFVRDTVISCRCIVDVGAIYYWRWSTNISNILQYVDDNILSTVKRSQYTDLPNGVSRLVKKKSNMRRLPSCQQKPGNMGGLFLVKLKFFTSKSNKRTEQKILTWKKNRTKQSTA